MLNTPEYKTNRNPVLAMTITYFDKYSRLFHICVIIALTAVHTASAEPQMNDGLIGLWKFEQVSSSLVKDFSMVENHGTVVGTGEPVWGADEFTGSISLFSVRHGNIPSAIDDPPPASIEVT